MNKLLCMFKHCKQNTGTCTVKPILSPIKTMLFMCCLLRKIKTCKVKKKQPMLNKIEKKPPTNRASLWYMYYLVYI